MPFLPFDLDAKKKTPKVARAAGVDVGLIAWGLLELWEHVWATKSDVVSEIALTGCFGPSGAIREALITYGFLESVESGYRVRGAARFLRVSSSRVAGGRARAAGPRGPDGQLLPTQSAGVQDLETQLPASSQPACAGDATSGKPALHPTPNTQIPLLSAGPVSDEEHRPTEPAEQKAAQEVFEHWVAVLRPGKDMKFTEDRRRRVSARLREGYSVPQLKRGIEGCSKSAWHMENGETDLELICRSASKLDRFIAKIDTPGTGPPKGREKRAAAEGSDWSKYQEGEDISHELYKQHPVGTGG